MPVFAQMVSFDTWAFEAAIQNLFDVVIENPLYLVGAGVVAVFVSRLVFTNRQI